MNYSPRLCYANLATIYHDDVYYCTLKRTRIIKTLLDKNDNNNNKTLALVIIAKKMMVGLISFMYWQLEYED